MATTKLNNGQLPTTLSSKTIDNTNDISTTTTKLKISGGTNGQVLSTDGSGNLSWATAGGGGLGAPTAIVTKTADESVTSSTTLQDDDELFYSLTNGKSYWIEIRLLTSRINTANNQLVRYAIQGNSDGYYFGSVTTGYFLLDGTATANAGFAASNAAVILPTIVYASAKMSSNFTFRLRWAQSGNNTTTVTVHKGSQMLIWEVA